MDRSKRYSEVTFAMAHDSHTCPPGKSYSDSDSVPIAVDQTVPIETQLGMGIRTVRISTKIADTQDELNLVHGPTSYGTFKNYLREVQKFLVANPNEIVTIIDEGSADFLSQHQFRRLLKETYESLFPVKDAANKQVTMYSPAKGMIAKLATDPTAWPTLQELIDQGQRLIVFQSSVGGVDWMLPAYDDVDNPCIATSESGNPLAEPDVRPGFPGSMLAPNRTQGSLYLINHYFYHHISKTTINESARNLNKWVVGDLLIENTLRACAQLKRRPNFINVDFFQGVMGTHSYLMDFVEALNAVDDQPGVGSAAWISALTDAMVKRGIYISDAHQLVVGGCYGIASAADPGLSLSSTASGGLILDTTNTAAPAQQWQLFYNTPGQGITLVNKLGKQIMIDSQMQPGVQNYQALQAATGFEPRRVGQDAAWVLRVAGAHACALETISLAQGATLLCCRRQDAVNNTQWSFTPLAQVPVTGTPAFINRTTGQGANNFEVLAPMAQGRGYVHYWRDNNASSGMPWHLGSVNEQGYDLMYGAAMVESSATLVSVLPYTNLGYELVYLAADGSWKTQIQLSGHYLSLWLMADQPSVMGNPQIASGSSRNTPALVLNTQQQFELLIPLSTGGFAHYRCDASVSAVGQRWTQMGVVAPTKHIDSITLIQNQFDKRIGVQGNLEAIARVGDQLQLFTAINGQWNAGNAIQVQGQNVQGVSGVHGFTQKSDGSFVVAAPLNSGGFVHLERGTDANFTWKQIGTFLTNLHFDTIALIQSHKYGNIEMIARIDHQLAHYYTSDNKNWGGGGVFTLS